MPWYVGTEPGFLDDRRLLALQFYIDDSGKNDPPVFILAGFVATIDSWVEFSRRWRDALGGLPYFKMKDANRCNGVFKGFSHAERDQKLIELASIIRDQVEFGIAIAIPHDAYNRVFTGKMMKAYDTPFTLTHSLMMNRVHKFLTEVGNHDEVDVIFDRQLDNEKDIIASAELGQEKMFPDVRRRFPTLPSFADDKRALPIQAADMLAWHIRRSWNLGKDKLRKLSAAGPILADEVTSIIEPCYEKDLHQLFAIGQSVASSLNTLFPHQAEALKEGFDQLATMANIEVMEKAVPFVPIEMVSFPAIGMGKYLLVRSCASCGNPHLHKRLGNRCLAEQTEVEWVW